MLANKMVPAEVAKRQLSTPEGTVEDCWIVTAIEAEGGLARVVFSGHEGAKRAIEYARAHYFPLHFRMTAEPGRYAQNGATLEDRDGVESRN